MFIVFLRFSTQKEKASEFMPAHKAWIKKGIENEQVLIVGSLESKQGGCIITRNMAREELDNYINEDPFVIEDIVTAEIIEFTPSMSSEALAFLTQS